MSATIEDCIAMSEDGDWYAFPADWSRGEVWSALASEDGGYWRDVLRMFRLRRGFVMLKEDEGGFDEWYAECEEGPDAIPAWIVVSR